MDVSSVFPGLSGQNAGGGAGVGAPSKSTAPTAGALFAALVGEAGVPSNALTILKASVNETLFAGEADLLSSPLPPRDEAGWRDENPEPPAGDTGAWDDEPAEDIAASRQDEADGNDSDEAVEMDTVGASDRSDETGRDQGAGHEDQDAKAAVAAAPTPRASAQAMPMGLDHSSSQAASQATQSTGAAGQAANVGMAAEARAAATQAGAATDAAQARAAAVGPSGANATTGAATQGQGQGQAPGNGTGSNAGTTPTTTQTPTMSASQGAGSGFNETAQAQAKALADAVTPDTSVRIRVEGGQAGGVGQAGASGSSATQAQGTQSASQGQTLPGQTLPGQTLPGQTLPGQTAVDTPPASSSATALRQAAMEALRQTQGESFVSNATGKNANGQAAKGGAEGAQVPTGDTATGSRAQAMAQAGQALQGAQGQSGSAQPGLATMQQGTTLPGTMATPSGTERFGDSDGATQWAASARSMAAMPPPQSGSATSTTPLSGRGGQAGTSGQAAAATESAQAAKGVGQHGQSGGQSGSTNTGQSQSQAQSQANAQAQQAAGRSAAMPVPSATTADGSQAAPSFADQLSRAGQGQPTEQARPDARTRPVVEQMRVNISKAAHRGMDRITIQLQPRSLGRVEVKLEFSGDGRVSAHVTVDKADTLDMLQRDARGLERALNDAGLKTDSGGLQFSLRGDGGATRTAQDDRGRAGSRGPKSDGPNAGAQDDDGPIDHEAHAMAAARARGGVNVRV